MPKRVAVPIPRSDLAELDFFDYFFSGLAFHRNKREQKMKKSITERFSLMPMMHNNAASEGTRRDGKGGLSDNAKLK